MNITTETIEAPKDLANYIEGLWVTRTNGSADQISNVHCCLPNGAWEIILDINDARFCVIKYDKQVWMPEMVGFATNGSPLYWQMRGDSILFGLVLLPETMELLTRRPTLLRTAEYVDLRSYEQTCFETLLQIARQVRSTQEWADNCFDLLRKELVNTTPTQQYSYFSEAVRLIRENVSTPSLDDLSDQVFVSKRQLQRTFQDKLGFGPKAYLRMMRFREAIHYIRKNPTSRMTDVAFDFGYADQSHFIREFKDYMGQNPRKFFSNWPETSSVIA
jgi:AraC-like DNA-binding protein